VCVCVCVCVCWASVLCVRGKGRASLRLSAFQRSAVVETFKEFYAVWLSFQEEHPRSKSQTAE
jgi:hypothetical protein